MASEQWRPVFHAAPQKGWMNDPNGFCEWDGKYHLFFQYNPKEPVWGDIRWGHLVSDDLTVWKELAPALAPGKDYDSGGVFSGSAIAKDGKLFLFYTGVAAGGCQSQNLAAATANGRFVKYRGNPIITTPECCKADGQYFRDPYVWEHDGRFYMLVGAQKKETADGEVLIYRSDDLYDWTFLNSAASTSNGEWGYMWECPNYAVLNGEEYLIFSPQGVLPDENRFLNKYQSGYFSGKMNYSRGVFEHDDQFIELDGGFDFYAPQVRKMSDGRTLLIGWLDMWDSPMPEQAEGWAGMMTFPRELRSEQGKIFQLPVKELMERRGKRQSLGLRKIKGEKRRLRPVGEVYELLLKIDMSKAVSVTLFLREGEKEATELTYDRAAQQLKLNRDRSGAGAEGERIMFMAVENAVLDLQILVDRSSIEVFGGVGASVMSARIYPAPSSQGISISSVGDVTLLEGSFYDLASVSR